MKRNIAAGTRVSSAVEGRRPPHVVSSAPDDSDAGGIGAMDGILGMHVSLARGAVHRHFAETCAHIALTPKQVGVLWLIDDNPGIAQAELGRRLHVDRASIMTIVNRLQSRRLVVRGRSALDGRMQTLRTTAAGRKLLAEARAAINEHEAWLKSRFTRDEIATLISLLRRIHMVDR